MGHLYHGYVNHSQMVIGKNPSNGGFFLWRSWYFSWDPPRIQCDGAYENHTDNLIAVTGNQRIQRTEVPQHLSLGLDFTGLNLWQNHIALWTRNQQPGNVNQLAVIGARFAAFCW